MVICRQALQLCPAEQHRMPLRCTRVTSTMPHGSGSAEENSETEKKRSSVSALEAIGLLRNEIMNMRRDVQILIIPLPWLTRQSLRPLGKETLSVRTEPDTPQNTTDVKGVKHFIHFFSLTEVKVNCKTSIKNS